jgi:hypothetical protein
LRVDQLTRDHTYLMSGGERRHIIQIKQHSVTYVPDGGPTLVTVDDAEFASDVLSANGLQLGCRDVFAPE